MMMLSREILALMQQEYALHMIITAHREDGLPRDGKLLTQVKTLSIQVNELRTRAAMAFAALNGWRHTSRRFRVDTLVRGGTHDSGDWGRDSWVHELFDHAVYFRQLDRPYRAAAIVGQPYNTALKDAQECAQRIGLVVHAPNNLDASWWYPGSTRMFCFTRPNSPPVNFLPDQNTAS